MPTCTKMKSFSRVMYDIGLISIISVIVITSKTLSTNPSSTSSLSCASIPGYKSENQTCSFPTLYSPERDKCLNFSEVDCGNRTEPITPCDYPDSGCSWLNEPKRMCYCPETSDLNFDTCRGLDDGLYPWHARMWSPYYIRCIRNRTLPSSCFGSSVIFNFLEKKCQLIYTVVNEAYKLSLVTDIPSSFLYMVYDSLRYLPEESRLSYISTELNSIEPTRFSKVYGSLTTVDINTLNAPGILISSLRYTTSSDLPLNYGNHYTDSEIYSQNGTLTELHSSEKFASSTNFFTSITSESINRGSEKESQYTKKHLQEYSKSVSSHNKNIFHKESVQTGYSDKNAMSTLVNGYSIIHQSSTETLPHAIPTSNRISVSTMNLAILPTEVSEKPFIISNNFQPSLNREVDNSLMLVKTSTKINQGENENWNTDDKHSELKTIHSSLYRHSNLYTKLNDVSSIKTTQTNVLLLSEIHTIESSEPLSTTLSSFMTTQWSHIQDETPVLHQDSSKMLDEKSQIESMPSNVFEHDLKSIKYTSVLLSNISYSSSYLFPSFKHFLTHSYTYENVTNDTHMLSSTSTYGMLLKSEHLSLPTVYTEKELSNSSNVKALHQLSETVISSLLNSHDLDLKGSVEPFILSSKGYKMEMKPSNVIILSSHIDNNINSTFSLHKAVTTTLRITIKKVQSAIEGKSSLSMTPSLSVPVNVITNKGQSATKLQPSSSMATLTDISLQVTVNKSQSKTELQPSSSKTVTTGGNLQLPTIKRQRTTDLQSSLIMVATTGVHLHQSTIEGQNATEVQPLPSVTPTPDIYLSSLTIKTQIAIKMNQSTRIFASSSVPLQIDINNSKSGESEERQPSIMTASIDIPFQLTVNSSQNTTELYSTTSVTPSLAIPIYVTTNRGQSASVVHTTQSMTSPPGVSLQFTVNSSQNTTELYSTPSVTPSTGVLLQLTVNSSQNVIEVHPPSVMTTSTDIPLQLTVNSFQNETEIYTIPRMTMSTGVSLQLNVDSSQNATGIHTTPTMTASTGVPLQPTVNSSQNVIEVHPPPVMTTSTDIPLQLTVNSFQNSNEKYETTTSMTASTDFPLQFTVNRSQNVIEVHSPSVMTASTGVPLQLTVKNSQNATEIHTILSMTASTEVPLQFSVNSSQNVSEVHPSSNMTVPRSSPLQLVIDKSQSSAKVHPSAFITASMGVTVLPIINKSQSKGIAQQTTYLGVTPLSIIDTSENSVAVISDTLLHIEVTNVLPSKNNAKVKSDIEILRPSQTSLEVFSILTTHSIYWQTTSVNKQPNSDINSEKWDKMTIALTAGLSVFAFVLLIVSVISIVMIRRRKSETFHKDMLTAHL